MRTIALTTTAAAALLAGVTIGGGQAVAQDETTFVTIGTGGVTGVYYPTGGAIQRLVNRNTDEHGVRVSVESTGGSVFNLNAIRAGELDMGVAQSDQQYNAYNGVGPFEEVGPNEELRAVFSIHGEPFTVVARADSGITSFDELPGNRVNVGNPGSGQRATMERLMEAYGWSMDDFSQVSELQSSEQAQALCDNNVDAIVFTVGHPSGSIQEATTTCETVLVPVQSEIIDQLVEENPYYAYTTVPGGMYDGNPDDVTTFGPKATFVTSTAVSEDVVYEIVSAVFDNLDDFRRLHPAFSTLDPEQMVSDGLSAPLHDGAARYYREHGLIEE
jgi:hypothetical protein